LKRIGNIEFEQGEEEENGEQPAWNDSDTDSERRLVIDTGEETTAAATAAAESLTAAAAVLLSAPSPTAASAVEGIS
jgi:hypothetical protein